jgi:two-component system, sensor histidine kinase YesM
MMMYTLKRLTTIVGDMKIRKKLMGIYIIVVIIPILSVGIILTNSMRNMVVERAVYQAANNTDRVERSLNEIVKTITDVSDRIYLDYRLHKLVLTEYSSVLEVVKAYSEYREFDSFSRAYKEISSIRFYVKNNTMLNNWQFFIFTPQIEKSSWYRQAVEGNGRVVWQYITDKSTGKTALCLTRLVIANYSDEIGVMQISVNSEYLNDLIKDEPFEAIVALDGNIVLSRDALGKAIMPDKQSLKMSKEVVTGVQFKTKYNNNESIIIKNVFRPAQSRNYFNIFTVIPVEAITRRTYDIVRLGAIIIIPSIALSLILILFFTKVFSNRIILLRSEMHKVVNGNFEISKSYKGKDEIGELYEDLNEMIIGIKRLIHDVYEEKLIREQLKNKQKEIEFKMLASQINPHFLFNALETIRMEARHNGDTKVAEMAKMLGKIMRHNLEISDRPVTLKTEFEVVKSYLGIQKFRFGDRVNYSISCEINPMEYYILPQLIQPVVENAFVHGLEETGEKGLIEINVNKDNNRLNIIISDNGIGISSDRLNEINKSLAEKENNIGSSIGLSNVNKRIKLFYGKDYGLKIESEQGKGTIVHINLPWKRKEKYKKIGI